MEIKNRRLNIRIDKATFKWLKNMAKAHKVTFSEMGRRILERERQKDADSQKNDRSNAQM